MYCFFMFFPFFSGLQKTNFCREIKKMVKPLKQQVRASWISWGVEESSLSRSLDCRAALSQNDQNVKSVAVMVIGGTQVDRQKTRNRRNRRNRRAPGCHQLVGWLMLVSGVTHGHTEQQIG